ncbi:LLM class flavin-dependent oxidoreductase [Georgenia sp. 10Sc9-8]|uniref:LLM class flavin-dependent oxidoreductase n=1 Tax=Georgenia halotolerans TaxID=3028317 RepID=A0ABT5TY27_9MICO|nr:LLM class flavin-dependent oxidoreductase [Georgenia halotolerans]
MRVGVVILPQQRWADARRRWRHAEALGFDHAWTYDHLAWRSLADEPWFATVPTLAAAALVTDRIRLGTFVTSPNFRHPVPLAKEAMSLDDLSEGRLLLGVGAGGDGVDADVLGQERLSPRQKIDRLAEFLDVLDRSLTAPVTSYAGEYFTAREARTYPGCVQQPRVPFVVATNGARGMRLAATYGQGWLTTGPATDDEEAWWDGVARRAQEMTALAPSGIDRYLSLDGPAYSLSSVTRAEDMIGRAAELGFTDVVVHWPRESGVYAGDEAVLEELGARLPQLRRDPERR